MSGAALPSRLESIAGRIAAAAKPAANVVSVPLDSITPNPRQPRKTFNRERLDQLAASIRKHGIIQPLLVTVSTPGRYELLAGERRWRAARIAGLPDVPAIVRDPSTLNKLVIALVENLDRDDMSPIDEARAVAELVDETSIQGAAEVLGRTKQWVSKRTRIAKAPDFVQEFVQGGAVRDVEALYELAKLAEDDPGKAKRAIADYVPGEHIREQLKAAQRPADPAQSAPSRDGSVPPSPSSGTGGEEKVSHAKLRPGTGQKPMKVEAVLRRGGDLFLVTAGGKVAVKFSAKARQQLAKIWNAE